MQNEESGLLKLMSTLPIWRFINAENEKIDTMSPRFFLRPCVGAFDRPRS
jgi:hypothetical protein